MPEPSTGRGPTKRLAFLLFAVILLYAAGLRACMLDRPFHRNLEGLSAFYGVLGRNYFRHDWSNTYGVPVQSMGQGNAARPTFYGHHPPLVPMFVAASYWLFDDPHQADFVPAEWITRLPTAMFTLGCILAIYALVRNRASERAALLSAALFAVVPMTVYFGGHADVINPQLVFFILLSIAAYLRFHAQPSIARLMVLCAAFLPAGFTDWPAFYIVVVFTAHFAFTRPFRSWRWIAAFGAFAVAVFATAYVQIYLTNGDVKWIVHLVEKRTITSTTDQHDQFTGWQWLTDAVIGHNVKRHTLPIVLLASAWIVVFGWRKDLGSIGTLVRLLLAWAALHALIGRQGVFQHEWWWWPLTPGLVICAALMIDWLCDRADRTIARPAVTSGIVAVLLVTLAVWTTRQGLSDIAYDAPMGEPHYSTQELGEAIRAVAPPNTSVLLAERDPDSMSLWYYADRPIVQEVWDSWTLEQILAGPKFASLPWSMRQSWPERAQGMVIPKRYLSMKVVTEFSGWLRKRYPCRETDKFLIFDLSRAPPGGN